MPQEHELIATIAMGLVLAYPLGYLALRLRLPPLVGYLLAGVVLGPFTPGFIGDPEIAADLAEIGVILLMFGVGLHFSVADLLAVRRVAVPAAFVHMGTGTVLGILLALAWGWSFGTGLVFGLALSIASTVVMLRAFEDRDELDTATGRAGVGVLVVEDLVIVMALVLLPAVASGLGGQSGASVAVQAATGNLPLKILLTLLKVAAFIGIMLVLGRRLLPWMLARTVRTGSRELFTLAVLAIALGIAYASAEVFDVSFALGAFFAGMVLAESDLSQRAAAESLPFQDAFAVLFFVSVGMLFDPSILVREPLSVLIVLLVVMVANPLAVFAVIALLGRPLAMGATIAAGIAQIGEFSFILAALGVSLALLSQQAVDLILAAALLSITLNPLTFVAMRRLAAWIAGRPDLMARIERFRLAEPEAEPAEPSAPASDHVVIVGYGRVGRMVAHGLAAAGTPYAVIGGDRRAVESLRRAGVLAVAGDGLEPGTLAEAGAGRAKLIVVTTPEGYRTRRIVELARELAPDVALAARADTDEEAAEFARLGVAAVVKPERAVAAGLLRDALRRAGLPETQVSDIVSDAKAEGWQAADQVLDEPELHVPEMRPHRGRA
jgi:CPA2 family monovalent cation:H+ antiporter-2